MQESEVWESGYYPVYGANGIVGYLDNYNTQSEAIYIIKDGSGVGTVSYVTGKCSATGTLSILQAKEGYSLQYLYYLLKVSALGQLFYQMLHFSTSTPSLPRARISKPQSPLQHILKGDKKR